jgi:hypothetical protein
VWVVFALCAGGLLSVALVEHVLTLLSEWARG